LTRQEIQEEITRVAKLAPAESLATRLSRIPACRSRGNPECLWEVKRVRQAYQQEDAQQRIATMQRLARSLELDIKDLPSEPTPRLLQLKEFNQKYKYLLENRPLEGNLIKNDAEGPIYKLAAQAASQITAEQTRTNAMPAVRQAIARGEIAAIAINATDDERALFVRDVQTEQLAAEAAKALNSKNTLFLHRKSELDMSDRERTGANAAESWSEPSETEMGLAVLREFTKPPSKVQGILQGSLTEPYEANWRSGDSLSVTTRLAHLHKEGCIREGRSYRCQVRLWLHGYADGGRAYNEIWRSAGSAQGVYHYLRTVYPTLQHKNGQLLSVVFLASSGRWSAPEIDNSFNAPKEVSALWKVLGGGKGSTSSGPFVPSSVDSANAAAASMRDEDARVKEDHVERMRQNEQLQREEMDRKCRQTKVC
jgi:hypothetical protein